jgi:hypothetical protein
MTLAAGAARECGTGCSKVDNSPSTSPRWAVPRYLMFPSSYCNFDMLLTDGGVGGPTYQSGAR